MVDKPIVNESAPGVLSKAAFVIFSALVGLSWLAPRVQLLISPVQEEGLLDVWAMPVTYFSAALFCSYVFALLLAVRGFFVARIALISSLLLMTIMAIIDSVAVVQFTVELAGQDALVSSPRNFWELTGSARWLLWFLFNYWLLISRGGYRRRRQT